MFGNNNYSTYWLPPQEPDKAFDTYGDFGGQFVNKNKRILAEMQQAYANKQNQYVLDLHDRLNKTMEMMKNQVAPERTPFKGLDAPAFDTYRAGANDKTAEESSDAQFEKKMEREPKYNDLMQKYLGMSPDDLQNLPTSTVRNIPIVDYAPPLTFPTADALTAGVGVAGSPSINSSGFSPWFNSKLATPPLNAAINSAVGAPDKYTGAPPNLRAENNVSGVLHQYSVGNFIPSMPNVDDVQPTPNTPDFSMIPGIPSATTQSPYVRDAVGNTTQISADNRNQNGIPVKPGTPISSEVPYAIGGGSQIQYGLNPSLDKYYSDQYKGNIDMNEATQDYLSKLAMTQMNVNPLLQDVANAAFTKPEEQPNYMNQLNQFTSTLPERLKGLNEYYQKQADSESDKQTKAFGNEEQRWAEDQAGKLAATNPDVARFIEAYRDGQWVMDAKGNIHVGANVPEDIRRTIENVASHVDSRIIQAMDKIYKMPKDEVRTSPDVDLALGKRAQPQREQKEWETAKNIPIVINDSEGNSYTPSVLIQPKGGDPTKLETPPATTFYQFNVTDKTNNTQFIWKPQTDGTYVKYVKDGNNWIREKDSAAITPSNLLTKMENNYTDPNKFDVSTNEEQIGKVTGGFANMLEFEKTRLIGQQMASGRQAKTATQIVRNLHIGSGVEGKTPIDMNDLTYEYDNNGKEILSKITKGKK